MELAKCQIEEKLGRMTNFLIVSVCDHGAFIELGGDLPGMHASLVWSLSNVYGGPVTLPATFDRLAAKVIQLNSTERVDPTNCAIVGNENFVLVELLTKNWK